MPSRYAQLKPPTIWSQVNCKPPGRKGAQDATQRGGVLVVLVDVDVVVLVDVDVVVLVDVDVVVLVDVDDDVLVLVDVDDDVLVLVEVEELVLVDVEEVLVLVDVEEVLVLVEVVAISRTFTSVTKTPWNAADSAIRLPSSAAANLEARMTFAAESSS